jgi:FAD/FMN-containing dehydrogenase
MHEPAGHPVVDAHRLRTLAAGLSGSLILPGDAAYESSRLVWNRAIDRRPAAIARCASAADVARTVDFVRAQALPLAVRGGGHNQAGLAASDGGLVIDTGGMQRVEVDVDRRVVRAEGGVQVSGLLAATNPHGLITPTGGCPDVGIAGLTLGGGESLIMAKYGAVCDNLLAAEVVTADGRLRRASAEENPDLFWALRGGGGNFGVVTRFDYQLFPLREVLAGLLLFPLARTSEVLRRYRDLLAGAPDELETSGGLTPQKDGPMLAVTLCHCGDRAAGEAMASRWRSALEPVADTLEWRAYAAELDVPPAPSAGSGVFLPELTDAVIEIFAEEFGRAPARADAVWNDFHGAVTRVPVDATAFPLRHPGYDLFISAPWSDAAGEGHARAWVARLRDRLAPFARGVYVNNLDAEGPARVREAYGPNYARLQEIKRTYDPDNLFRGNQNIEP